MTSLDPTINQMIAYPDHLPQQSQHKMGFPLHKILRSNIDNIAANRTGRVERQCLILVDSINTELSLVDSSFIDRMWYGGIDQLAVDIITTNDLRQK